MKKIVIKRTVSLFIFVIITIITILGIYFFVKWVYSQDFTSTSTKSKVWELIGLILIFFPMIYNSILTKDEYLSEIIKYEDYLVLIYKTKSKITNRRTILLKDIESFNVYADLNIISTGRSSYTQFFIKNEITLCSKEKICFDLANSDNAFLSPSKYLYDIILISDGIKSFNLSLFGDAKFLIEKINYFKRFKKKVPFGLNCKFFFKTASVFWLIILAIFIILFTVCVINVLILSMPAPKLSALETQYAQLYDKAMNIENCEDKIKILNEAQKIISNSSDIYLQKAYCYKDLKDYENAIKEAKEGIKYVNNQSIYQKKNNFKFKIGKDDIALYTVLGRSYYKTKRFKEAVEAYSYVIKHTSYKYTDAYFKRAKAYYSLLEFDEAKKDLYKHKKIIQECQNDEYCESYNNDNLKNVNDWLVACDIYKKKYNR